MGNGFSIERAASDTAISSKSGMLTRIFKQLLHSQFSNIISEKILYEVSKGKFKNIINSYEAQPFQNSVFKKVKKFDEKIITHGFFHTALSPMATSLIYRSYFKHS